MAVDSAVPALLCTQEEFDKLQATRAGFCFLDDNKKESHYSNYKYCQAVFLENLNESWDIVEDLCPRLKIPLTVTLAEVESIFCGLDAATIADLYALKRNAGLPRKTIIAMEEERLLHLTRSVFDRLMAKLQVHFNKKPTAHCPTELEETPDDEIDADAPTDGSLPAPVEAAYQSYRYVESQLCRRFTDKEAHAYLKERGPKDYDVPDFSTWQRYVGAGRKYYKKKKNQPRAGRRGKSVVASDQL